MDEMGLISEESRRGNAPPNNSYDYTTGYCGNIRDHQSVDLLNDQAKFEHTLPQNSGGFADISLAILYIVQADNEIWYVIITSAMEWYK